jgi:hypothetical protein
MKKTVLILICALSLLLGVAAVAPDKASAVAYTPKARLVFNNPRGSHAKELAIITEINRSIDAAPRGSTIRMAQYLFDINSVADKLVRAHKRGVNVQVLIDDGTSNKQIRRVKRALGTNKKRTSYVTTCKRGCMSDIASVMHAKFYLFSRAGSAKYVSIISSANPYTGNTFKSWNNSHTIVNNYAIYHSLSKYFTDMIRDKTDRNYYRTTTSGRYKLFLFPGVPRRGDQIVVPLKVFGGVTCHGAGRGYGSGGRTVIRVGMWGWTYGRLDVAKRLWALHNRGCKVDVILNRGRSNRRVIQALTKTSKTYGKMKVYDAWVDKNHNDYGEYYMHHKTFMVNGKLFGKSTKVTYTGSQNFSAPATLSNNDIVLRITGAGTYDRYSRELTYIRKHYTHRVYKMSKSSVMVASHGTLRAERLAVRNNVDTESEFDSVLDR